MKLSEIEEVGYLLTAYDEEDVYEDGDINYDVFEFHRDNYTQNDLNRCGLTQWDFCDCQALYTAEKMQEYAKANCWELINWYVETTGDVNHAAEMKISMRTLNYWKEIRNDS